MMNKGLNYAIPDGKINIKDTIIDFERAKRCVEKDNREKMKSVVKT